MMPAPGVHEAMRRVVGVLEAMGLQYAIGGAVGMGFAGVVRGTRDLDLLALLPAIRTQEFAGAVEEQGFTMRDQEGRPIPVEVPRMVASMRDSGQFRIWWRDTKVEVFVPKVPLQDSILKRRRRVDLGEFSLWITTPEDLILLKMIFHREKDLLDVKQLLAVNQDVLDWRYIEEWIEKTLDADAGAELRQMMKRLGG